MYYLLMFFAQVAGQLAVQRMKFWTKFSCLSLLSKVEC